jgi:Zn-dependent membrane protease YugP
MQRLIGKVTDLFSMLQASNFFADFIIFVLVALMVELDAVKKALSKEKIARLVIDPSLAEEKAARRPTE